MEKRLYPRKRFDRAIKCITQHIMFDCQGVNISPGGCCLRSPVSIDVGEELALLIPIGNGENNLLFALGKVIWAKEFEAKFNDLPFYAGIKFLATSSKNFPELENLCQNPD